MVNASAVARPGFRELRRDECERVLARNSVGRLAFTFKDRVDIHPIHYAYDDGWLYGRIDPGEKFSTIKHNRWVAFEVDEVDGVFDWRSVVVRGAFYRLEKQGAPDEAAARDRAIKLLQDIVPGTGTPTDPVGFRDIYFRIHTDDMTGRAAKSP